MTGRPPVRVVRARCLPYESAWRLQERLVRRRADGGIPDVFLLLEHPPVYTIGRRGGEGHLRVPEERLRDDGAEVFRVDRGGDVTYHGPGQVVGYPIVDLAARGWNLRKYLRDLEDVLIRALGGFGIEADRDDRGTGVWVADRKIASIGVRAVRWTTMHGFALNVGTDLAGFDRIVPCGIEGCRMTSVVAEIGRPVDPADAHPFLIDAFAEVFGREPEEVPIETLDERFLAAAS